MAKSVADLYDALRKNGLASQTTLASSLGVSQPTVSRLIATAGDAVVQVGRGPVTRYGLRRSIRMLPADIPVYRVSPKGEVATFGVLSPLTGGRFLFQRDGLADAVFDGLPWFVQDIRPQGFLGRGFPLRYQELDLPDRINQWSDDDALVALALRGEDCVGDLIVGGESLDRHMASVGSPVHWGPDDYPDVVERILSGVPAASSAGGEQPKFAAISPDGVALLVKFSPPVGESDVARRWADLLVCEHLALQLLDESGISASHSNLIERRGRYYLDVEREDRTETGRRAYVSGTVLDAEFVGSGRGWNEVAKGLVKESRLPATADGDIRWMGLFGGFIGNTDMHLGNISFFTDDYASFRLAPVYDMLPMILAPTDRGEIPVRVFKVPTPRPEMFNEWSRAASVAIDFWSRAAADERISMAFREIAQEYQVSIRKTVDRIPKMVVSGPSFGLP